jgi:hypothetical protein
LQANCNKFNRNRQFRTLQHRFRSSRYADQPVIACLAKGPDGSSKTMNVSSFLKGLPGGQALNNAKDVLLAKGARTHLNKVIERYGTVLDLQLNTLNRFLSFTLLLKGEASPIEVHVREYTLSTEEGKSLLMIDGRKVETSREWLTELIRDHVGQKPFAVPEKLEWVVQLLR